MIVIVDERTLVIDGYKMGFNREGISSAGFDPLEFNEWIWSVSPNDLSAVEAFLISGDSQDLALPETIKKRSNAPVIVMSEKSSLQNILQLFSVGVDDVVRKPVHVKEIIARMGAIINRQQVLAKEYSAGEIRIFLDGRPPVINGKPFQLPRREYRILEYLVRNKGKRITKTQLFNVVYGLFENEVDESVVESHVSKLRKKLRKKLGYDPVDAKRFLGYCLSTPSIN